MSGNYTWTSSGTSTGGSYLMTGTSGAKWLDYITYEYHRDFYRQQEALWREYSQQLYESYHSETKEDKLRNNTKRLRIV